MDKFRSFMRSRTGPDHLVLAFLVIYWPLSLLARLTHWSIFDSLAFVCLFLAIARFFSKNAPRRQEENRRFLRFIQPLTMRLAKLRGRLGEYRTHRRFSCPNCDKTLRVPAGKGKIIIHCPHCAASFEKKT